MVINLVVLILGTSNQADTTLSYKLQDLVLTLTYILLPFFFIGSPGTFFYSALRLVGI